MYPQTHYQPMMPHQQQQHGYTGQGPPLNSQQVQYVNTANPATNTGNSPTTNVAHTAANKAGAYGGSEVGAIVGGAVGPPVIGGIVGGLVGERLGEKGMENSGLGAKVGRARDKLGRQIGHDNVDKLGEITLVALGYSEDETCICCPCMPRSQLMLFVMIAFSVFIWYRMGVGSSWESGCKIGIDPEVKAVDDPPEDTGNYSYVVERNNQTYLVNYPCAHGYDYMVTGAVVWAVFLPFHIFTLLGNCWRQCCCCLCDPLVCCSSICDIIKRYCCECGRFSLVAFVWYSMCIFQVVWACSGLYWLVREVFPDVTGGDTSKGHTEMLRLPAYVTFLEVTLASVVLDLALAGSELVHKVQAHFRNQPDRVQPQSSYEMKQEIA